MTTSGAEQFESLLANRARIGFGVPVHTPRPSMSALYEFGGGYPDPESFPYEGMIEATKQMIAAEGAAAMTYGDAQGYRALRELICHKYELFEAFKAEPENIIVSNGSGQALALAFSAFVDPGDVIITEAPTFSGTLNTMRRHGPEILDVPLDDEGIVTSAVRERLEGLRRQGRRAKLIYTIVNFQNPAGMCQSLRRRHELIALAHEYETLILEDDAYGELRFEGETLPPLYALDRGGRVIRAGTLSKILGAGVRIGWLCAPKEMIPAFQGFLFGGGVNPYMSRVATYFLRDHLVPHVQRLIAVYRTKRDATLRGLDETLKGTDYAVSRPEGGFFLWMKLPTGTDQKKLADLAVRGARAVHAGPRVLPAQARGRGPHPSRLQLRVAREVLRGRAADRQGDPGGRARRSAAQGGGAACGIPRVGSHVMSAAMMRSAVARLVATGTLWTLHTRSSARMSGSCGCAESGSTKKNTASTPVVATRAAIWASPPSGPLSTASTSSPTLSRSSRAVWPVATVTNCASVPRLQVAHATRSTFLLRARPGPAVASVMDHLPRCAASAHPPVSPACPKFAASEPSLAPRPWKSGAPARVMLGPCSRSPSSSSAAGRSG